MHLLLVFQQENYFSLIMAAFSCFVLFSGIACVGLYCILLFVINQITDTIRRLYWQSPGHLQVINAVNCFFIRSKCFILNPLALYLSISRHDRLVKLKIV